MAIPWVIAMPTFGPCKKSMSIWKPLWVPLEAFAGMIETLVGRKAPGLMIETLVGHKAPGFMLETLVGRLG